MPSQMLYKEFFRVDVRALLTLKRALTDLLCPLWRVLYCPYNLIQSIVFVYVMVYKMPR